MTDDSPRPVDDSAPIPPPEPEEEWAGRRIGPYVVERKLSRGGMGQVLLGNDEVLRRKVAIKVMDRKYLSDEDARKRFEREARAAAAIQHRHIAAVYLVGVTEQGVPYLAMEYVDGGSLMEAIRKRRSFNYSEIASMMEQVASALEAAARQNIIHRDIKPANIMLDRAGEAKVVDFGLAKIFFEDSFMTQDGLVLGTPSYMAPEQSQGRVVDHRADIYSFGAMFYHVIVGKAPFTADSPVQIMMKHVTAPLVPMRTINPHVPIEFDDVVGRCMRKDVDERYQDYESLLRDVKRIRLQALAREGGSLLGHSSAGAPPPPPPGASANWTAAAAPPPAAHLVTDHHAEHHRTSPAVVITIAAAALLGIVAIIAVVFMPETQDPPAVERPPEQQRAITLWLQQAAQKARGPVEENEDPDELSAAATGDILRSLATGVENFQTEEGTLPASLLEIADPGRVLVIFETNEAGTPLDGWGTPLDYDPDTGEIRSAGQDGIFETPDDVLSTEDLETESDDQSTS